MRLLLDRNKYSGVPVGLREQLFAFADRAVLKETTAGDYLWGYLDVARSGGGDNAAGNSEDPVPVVFFSGGAKLPVYSFAVIEALAQNNRVVAIAQPPCQTLDEHFAGVAEVLRREGIDGFHVAGSSWGGCIAQAAAVKYPTRVRKMVLSSTGLAGGRAIALMLRLHLASVRRADPRKVVAGFRARALKLLAGDPDTGALWNALFADIYDRSFTHKDYVSLISTQLDFVERYAPVVAKSTWTNPVLILTAKDESAGNASWRAALTRAYPAAIYSLFASGGHHPALQQAAEYRRVVAEFMAQG